MNKRKEINALIKSCQQRDFKAQRALYDLYVDRVYFIVRRYISDKYFATNVVQDVFLKIFIHIEKFDINKGSFSTWLNTIAVRIAISHLRKKNINFVYDNDMIEIKSNEVDILAKLNTDDILNILASIHKKYRTVFNLFEIDGYNHKEIGVFLGISESSSRAYLSRAKKILQKRMEEMEIVQNYGYGR